MPILQMQHAPQILYIIWFAFVVSFDYILTKINLTSVVIMTSICEYIHAKQWEIITHPCSNLNGGLVE